MHRISVCVRCAVENLPEPDWQRLKQGSPVEGNQVDLSWQQLAERGFQSRMPTRLWEAGSFTPHALECQDLRKGCVQ